MQKLAYDLSSCGVIESFEQLYGCTLSAAGLSDKGNCLTLVNAEVKAMEHVHGAARRVRKVNVREIYLPDARILSK